MRKTDWRDALKVDFSRDSALKAALLADLMHRPDAPADAKEDMPMKTTVKHSTRALVAVLIVVVLLSGAALAAMKTWSLGPFATYTQTDPSQQIDAYLNANRSVWEGKLFFKDGVPAENLAEYILAVGKGERPYELYDADGERTFPTVVDGQLILVRWDDAAAPADVVPQKDFDTFEEVKPYLNAALNPALPTVPPDGYAPDRFSLFADEDGKPHPATPYLSVFYKNQDKEMEMFLQLMNEETKFESSTAATLTELTVGGHTAIWDGKNLEVLIGDVLYAFYPRDSGVTKEELIKMAESIQG